MGTSFPTFVVVAVDNVGTGVGSGVAPSAPATIDLDALGVAAATGKSRTDAMQAMMAVNELRTAGPEVMNSLMSGKFINDLIESDKLFEVDSILHKTTEVVG